MHHVLVLLSCLSAIAKWWNVPENCALVLVSHFSAQENDGLSQLVYDGSNFVSNSIQKRQIVASLLRVINAFPRCQMDCRYGHRKKWWIHVVKIHALVFNREQLLGSRDGIFVSSFWILVLKLSSKFIQNQN